MCGAINRILPARPGHRQGRFRSWRNTPNMAELIVRPVENRAYEIDQALGAAPH